MTSTFTPFSWALVLSSLIGCSEGPAPARSRGVPRFVEAPAEAPNQVPDETVAALRALFLAANDDELPSREVIESYVQGQGGVQWLAVNETSVLVRTRALSSLSMFPSSGSEFILGSALAADNPSWAKSAAMEGLRGWNLSVRTDLRSLVSAQLYNEDPKTALVAVGVLGPVPEARGELEQYLAKSPEPSVAAAIRRWLEPNEGRTW